MDGTGKGDKPHLSTYLVLSTGCHSAVAQETSTTDIKKKPPASLHLDLVTTGIKSTLRSTACTIPPDTGVLPSSKSLIPVLVSRSHNTPRDSQIVDASI